MARVRPSQEYVAIEVPASEHGESAAQERDAAEVLEPGAESSAELVESAESMTDLVGPQEPMESAEPEPRRAPLLDFWRRKDRGGLSV